MESRKTGITRMDAALDAMRPLGFGTRLVRQTANELLKVYGVGSKGWPFIEEASYKLLIETILSKQQDFTEEQHKDGARRDDVINETSLTRIDEVGPSGLETQNTLLRTGGGLDSSSQASGQDNALLGNLETTGYSGLLTKDTLLHACGGLGCSPSSQANASLGNLEIAGPSSMITHDTLLHTSGSFDSSSQANDQDNASLGNLETGGPFGLVTQDALLQLHTSGGLDSSSQATDQDNAPLGNLKTDVRDLALLADKGGHGHHMNKSENELKPADNVKESNDNIILTNVENTSDKTCMTQSSEASEHLPCHRREGHHGWIGNGSDDDVVEYVYFPIPTLSKQIEKMIGRCEPPQSSSRRRRKSRWDEKPKGM